MKGLKVLLLVIFLQEHVISENKYTKINIDINIQKSPEISPRQVLLKEASQVHPEGIKICIAYFYVKNV